MQYGKTLMFEDCDTLDGYCPYNKGNFKKFLLSTYPFSLTNLVEWLKQRSIDVTNHHVYVVTCYEMNKYALYIHNRKVYMYYNNFFLNHINNEQFFHLKRAYGAAIAYMWLETGKLPEKLPEKFKYANFES